MQLLAVIQLQREQLMRLSESKSATAKRSATRCENFHSGRATCDSPSAPSLPPSKPLWSLEALPIAASAAAVPIAANDNMIMPSMGDTWSLTDDDSASDNEDDGSFVFSTSERSQLLCKVELQREEASASRINLSREGGHGVGTAENAAARVAPPTGDPGDGGGELGYFDMHDRQQCNLVLKAEDWFGRAPQTGEDNDATDADAHKSSPCSSMAACVGGRLEVRLCVQLYNSRCVTYSVSIGPVHIMVWNGWLSLGVRCHGRDSECQVRHG